MNILRRLKPFYWPYRKYLFSSLAFLLVVVAITVVYPIVLQLTIDEVVLMERYSIIPYIAAGFFLIMIIKSVSAFMHQYMGDLFGITAVYKLREALYDKLQVLSFKYYDNARTGDLMARQTTDVNGFRNFISSGVSDLVEITLLIFFSLGVMFYYSIPLALITMASMPFLAVAVYQFDKRVHPAFRGIRQSFGRLNTRVQENISGMDTVKSLSKEEFEISRFSDSNESYRQHYLFTSRIWSKYFPVMELIGNICVVSLLAFGGVLVVNGDLSLGALVAFFSLVWYIMDPLMDLGFVINTFSQAKASGERLLEILDAKEDVTNKEDAVDTPITGHVTFRDVTLTYTENDEKALQHITFDAPAGTIIGLMGATGSGKTSMTQLIPRFYEPEQGDVLVDGRPVNDYQLTALRQQVGFVLQESFLFSTTIRENIRYGNSSISEERIIDAAKRAQAHDFISKMPKGYDTMLGERGMGLSGGQKQRIAIARAICINPAILVLDDATSAVDMDTEFKIQKALKEVMKGRTTFIIAHRIASVKHADTILVLENGEIVERGTHKTLVQNNGPYERIYNIQYQDREQVLEIST